MIGPYFEGGRGLDLFAGSGGLGIEALSRGFEHCIFVDRDFKSIQTVKSNLKTLELTKNAQVYRNDAERALHAAAKRETGFRGIFLDPPYKEQKLKALLTLIDEYQMLEEDGFIVAEHDREVELPETVGDLLMTRKETYGLTGVAIYKKRG